SRPGSSTTHSTSRTTKSRSTSSPSSTDSWRLAAPAKKWVVLPMRSRGREGTLASVACQTKRGEGLDAYQDVSPDLSRAACGRCARGNHLHADAGRAEQSCRQHGRFA